MPNERRNLFGGTSSGGAGTSGGGGFNQYDEERENDRAVDEIANRAAALKRITIDIQEEAEQQQGERPSRALPATSPALVDWRRASDTLLPRLRGNATASPAR